MKELVNLKKVDIIKEMIKEKEQNLDSKINFESACLNEVITNYFNEYIEPILLELNNNGIIEYNKDEIKKDSLTRRNYLKALSYIREVLNPIEEDEDILFKNDTKGIKNEFSIQGLDKYRQLCDDKGIFFLSSKDKKLKKEFAEKIKNVFEYENKITTYSSNYIKPLLKNLGKNHKLNYFENPKNEQEEYMNYAIEGIMISFLHQLHYTKLPLGKYNSLLNLIDNGSDYDRNALALEIYQKGFLTNFSNEDIKKTFEISINHGKNKNKYGKYNFSDYNSAITNIFDIK